MAIRRRPLEALASPRSQAYGWAEEAEVATAAPEGSSSQGVSVLEWVLESVVEVSE